MYGRSLLGAFALVVVAMSSAGAQSADTAKYPDLHGQWNRFVVPGVRGQPAYDQTQSWGPEQHAPLTPEYQAIYQASLKDQANGGHGNNRDRARCGPSGMPLMMVAFRPLEFVVTPQTTYVLVGDQDQPRRIFTDGRAWPEEITPTYGGYSIGRWIDSSGDGRYDLLEVETSRLPGAARLRLVRPAPARRQRVRSSRSASTSTRRMRTSCTTRSPPSTTP